MTGFTDDGELACSTASTTPTTSTPPVDSDGDGVPDDQDPCPDDVNPCDVTIHDPASGTVLPGPSAVEFVGVVAATASSTQRFWVQDQDLSGSDSAVAVDGHEVPMPAVGDRLRVAVVVEPTMTLRAVGTLVVADNETVAPVEVTAQQLLSARPEWETRS
jgi:hypothetical protein